VGSWRETCNSWGSIFVLTVFASTGGSSKGLCCFPWTVDVTVLVSFSNNTFCSDCPIFSFIKFPSVNDFDSNGPTSCVTEFAFLDGSIEGIDCSTWAIDVGTLASFSMDAFDSDLNLLSLDSIVFSFGPNKSVVFSKESASVDGSIEWTDSFPWAIGLGHMVSFSKWAFDANDSLSFSLDSNDCFVSNDSVPFVVESGSFESPTEWIGWFLWSEHSRVSMSFSDNVFDSNGSVLFSMATSTDDPNEVSLFVSPCAFETAVDFSGDSFRKPLVAAETPESNLSRRIFEAVICWSTLATSSFESSQSTLLKISLTFANASTGRPSLSSTRGGSIEITEDEASISEKRTFNQKYSI